MTKDSKKERSTIKHWLAIIFLIIIVSGLAYMLLKCKQNLFKELIRSRGD